MVYERPSKVYLYVTWKHELERVLIAQKVLSSQKIKRVFLNWNVLSSQRFLGQTLAYSIRNCDWSSLYKLSLSREISSSLLLTFEKGLKDRGSLVVKEFWTQRKDCPCVFKTCKRILLESGKSQVGCLRTGRRHGKWPNQYKSSLHFSLPLNFFYLLLFIFGLKEVYFELSFK